MDLEKDNGLEVFMDIFEKVYPRIAKRHHSLHSLEEIRQETFLRFFKNLHNLRGDTLEAWMWKVIKNIVIDFSLQDKKFVLLSENEANAVCNTVSSGTSSETEAKDREFVLELLACIALLPQNYQDPIKLRYLQDLTYKEISTYLKKPYNTVKSHVRRGLNRLKPIITERGLY